MPGAAHRVVAGLEAFGTDLVVIGPGDRHQPLDGAFRNRVTEDRKAHSRVAERAGEIPEMGIAQRITAGEADLGCDPVPGAEARKVIDHGKVQL